MTVALASVACGGGAHDNGVATLSATAALAKVEAALKTVDTVHVTGHVLAGGRDITLDLHDKAGAGLGTLAVAGGKANLVLVTDTIYINGDKAALAALGASSAEASLAAGKWLSQSTSASGALSPLSDLLSTTALFHNVTTPQGDLKSGSTTTLDGRKVLALVDSSPAGNGTLYVAETGEPLPVRVDQPGSNGGRLDFEYGGTVTVKAPSGAIDVSRLPGG